MGEIAVAPRDLTLLAESLRAVRLEPPVGAAADGALSALCLGSPALAAALAEVTTNWSAERARVQELLARAAGAAHRAAEAYVAAEHAVLNAVSAIADDPTGPVAP